MDVSRDEATAFLSTLECTAPDAPTACAGWTAHHIVAHLAAGAAEMADLTEEAMCGRAPRPTRDFARREAPFVAMADDELRDRLVTEAIRLGVAIDSLASTRLGPGPGPGSTVAFSGRRLGASELTMHGRSEAALHRWDMAGDDDISQELLAQPELTAHAVDVLNTMIDGSPESVTARTTSAAITELRANFAAPGQPDVVLVVDGAGARLELDEPRSTACARADAATRLLALWGRRSPSRTIAWNDHGAARSLATFLWGVGALREGGAAATLSPTTLSPTTLSEIR
jgi:hypothetical protein